MTSAAALALSPSALDFGPGLLTGGPAPNRPRRLRRYAGPFSDGCSVEDFETVEGAPRSGDRGRAPSLSGWRSGERWLRVDPDVLTTLSEEITKLSARIGAETYRLLALVAEFDRLEGWKREGFGSCVEWLAYRTRLDKVTARERVRVARALTELPLTREAMSRGELSFSQVRAITRAADADSEGELLEHARSLTASQLERLARSWKRLGREEEEELERRLRASRSFSVFPDDEGGYRVVGRLEPEVGALLMRAIEAASDALYRGSVPETTPEQRRADALALLTERALAAGFGAAGRPEASPDDSAEAGGEREGRLAAAEDAPSLDDSAEACRSPAATGTRAERYLVVLHVDESSLTGQGGPGALDPAGGPHLEDGSRVAAETARRLACDASVVTVRRRGKDVEVQGRTRTVPPRLRRALEIRDRGCRFPGCGCRFTEPHHIVPWFLGGPTRLDNLVLLCATHHVLLHHGGFRLEKDPDRPGRSLFYSPEGVPIPEAPPRMSVDGVPLGGKLRAPRWEEDVPLAFYLRALSRLA